MNGNAEQVRFVRNVSVVAVHTASMVINHSNFIVFIQNNLRNW